MRTFYGRTEKGRIILYRRIGILSFSSPGHFYPLTALGRRLQSRGHEVVYFQVADQELPTPYPGAKQSGLGTWFGLEGHEEFTQATIINVAK